MRPIPPKLKRELAADPFMLRCIHSYLPGATPCSGRVEWEHAFTFAGRQLNERWAIVPVCTGHHRGGGLVKDLNRYAALLRMTIQERLDVRVKYRTTDWEQLRSWFSSKFPTFRLPNVTPEYVP